MANFLRLRRQGHAPKALDGTETLYADADGTLKHQAPDGTVTDVGAGGESGGSQPVFFEHHDFAFDDVGLNAGIAFYTPSADVYVYDAWFVPQGSPPSSDNWDGTTPLADVGDASTNFGFFADGGGSPSTADMTQTGTQTGGVFIPPGVWNLRGTASLTLPLFVSAGTAISVWVSQNGQAGGADPGSSQGAARVVLMLALA